MKSIDIKSLLIGILGTALVMVLMGVAHSKGKYQLECYAKDCWVINTNTGYIKKVMKPAVFETLAKQHKEIFTTLGVNF